MNTIEQKLTRGLKMISFSIGIVGLILLGMSEIENLGVGLENIDKEKTAVVSLAFVVAGFGFFGREVRINSDRNAATQ